MWVLKEVSRLETHFGREVNLIMNLRINYMYVGSNYTMDIIIISTEHLKWCPMLQWMQDTMLCQVTNKVCAHNAVILKRFSLLIVQFDVHNFPHFVWPNVISDHSVCDKPYHTNNRYRTGRKLKFCGTITNLKYTFFCIHYLRLSPDNISLICWISIDHEHVLLSKSIGYRHYMCLWPYTKYIQVMTDRFPNSA